MNLCYFVCSSKYGGLEKIVVDSCNQLSKIHDTYVLLPNNCEYIDKFNNVTIIKYTSKDNRRNPFLYIEIYKKIKELNIDIVHTHGAKATEIFYRLNNLTNVSLHIATKHNIRKGKIFNKVKNVISVSEEVSKTISNTSKIIYFGLDTIFIENNSKNSIFTISALGRLDKIKGFDVLIKSVSNLKFDFRLNIIGEGPHRSELENLIKKYSLEKKVFLLGFQTNIEELLSKSHLQIISSHSEGFPISLIEGLHYSDILISTKVGGISEVLEKSFLYELNELENKINDIFVNYEEYKNAFEKNKNKYKDVLTSKNYINELSNYYNEIYKKDK